MNRIHNNCDVIRQALDDIIYSILDPTTTAACNNGTVEKELTPYKIAHAYDTILHLITLSDEKRAKRGNGRKMNCNHHSNDDASDYNCDVSAISKSPLYHALYDLLKNEKDFKHQKRPKQQQREQQQQQQQREQREQNLRKENLAENKK